VEVEFNVAASGTRTIIADGVHATEIDIDPNWNSAGRALSALVDAFGKPEGYSLRIKTNMPPSKGLGLSGAVAVGAVVCANRHFKLGLSGIELVRMASKGEPSHHMDNVSASALGGFNIVVRDPSGQNEAITTFPPPKDLGLAVLVPDVRKMSTEAARLFVPEQLQMVEHVQSIGRAARIAAAFANGDVNAILETVPWDGLVEPARANGGVYGKGVDSNFLLEEKKILLREFHVAETISGAGPSRALWYSISEDHKHRRKNRTGIIQPAIALVTDRLRTLGLEVREVFMTKPSSKGATFL
jgi:homoserine kinase